jgi:hypothetical protein
MGSQRGPRDHDHPVGNVGREPRTGRRLLVLRWRLTTSLRSSVNSFHSATIKGRPSGRPACLRARSSPPSGIAPTATTLAPSSEWRMDCRTAASEPCWQWRQGGRTAVSRTACYLSGGGRQSEPARLASQPSGRAVATQLGCWDPDPPVPGRGAGARTVTMRGVTGPHAP